MTRRSVITGGAGFIGSTTARMLVDAGNRVTLADVSPGPPEASFALGQRAAEVELLRCRLRHRRAGQTTRSTSCHLTRSRPACSR